MTPTATVPASPTPGAQVRLSYQTFAQDPARVASFERGVRVMKSRDGAPKDSAAYRTSWQYWSAMHGYYGPQAGAGLVADSRNAAPVSAQHFFDGINDLTPPAAPPNVAQRVWDMCQHGTRHFLTWHRMFLYYFERVLRAAAGDTNLRLPYWDYTDPAQLGFPAALGQPQLGGQPNALFDVRRRSQNVQLNSNATNIDTLLQQANFDLVLMDLQMPVMDGYESTRRIRALPGELGRVPIVALTALALPMDRERAEACGMNDFLTKPVRKGDLGTLLDKYMVHAPAAAAAGPKGDLNVEGDLLRELFDTLGARQLDRILDTFERDATKDLLGGSLQAMTASIPAALPLMADKRVRVLAVTGPKRIPQMPDVPSWQEQGVANAEVINYWGIVAPAGTPREPIARLAAEVRRILAQPDVRERLEREGAELTSGPPDQLGTIIERDLAHWKKLIVEAKLSFE